MRGKIFGRDRALIYRRIHKAGPDTAEPVTGDEITQVAFDEMRHFIGAKKL